MDKPSKKYFLVAFKQDTSVGPIYSNYRWVKAFDKESAIMEHKIQCYIPIGIIGSYEIIREGLTKKEDVPTESMKE